MSDADFDIELKLLLEAIYLKYHHDFRQYATASLKRRLTAAMQRFGCRSLSGLQERVLREADVFRELLSSLTIQVSDMFRDPTFFKALRQHVLPVLRTYPSLKIWCAGCSTGQEVYSLAILLHEEGLLERSIIYATDINPDALRVAQTGIYDVEQMAAFSEAYLAAGGRSSLSDYYTAAYGSAIFDKFLRKDVVFSDHSLLTDEVFAEVHLVTCRNVLIYFNREAQDRAFGLFRDALVRKGFLGLGSKESVAYSKHADDFTDYVREERIFQKR